MDDKNIYNWTISEVNNLYSTLTDLQTKVTQCLGKQLSFDQLITRVDALEKKLSRNSNSGSGVRSELSEQDVFVLSDDFDLSSVKIEQDGNDLELPDFQNDDDDNSRDKEWEPTEEDCENDIAMDEEDEERELRARKAKPEIKPVSVKANIRVRSGKACTICNKILGSSWHLRRHMLGIHQVGRPYQCNGCKETFLKWFRYDSHKESCEEYLSANKSAKALLGESTSEENFALEFKKCKLCNNDSVEYTSPEEFYQHIKEIHPDQPLDKVKANIGVRSKFKLKNIPKACTICNKMLSSGWHLRRHMLGVHKVGHPYQCNGCKETFYKLRRYLAHKESCRKLSTAGTGKGKSKITLLNKNTYQDQDHATISEGESNLKAGQEGSPLHCKLCNNDLEYTQEEFVKHIKAIHPNPPLGKAKDGRPCPLCLKVFTRNSQFKIHLYNVHKLGELNVVGKGCSKNDGSITASTTSDFTSTLKLPCKLCNNGLEYTRQEFTVHIKEIHTSEPPITALRTAKDCPICLKSFKANWLLKYHVYKVHKIGKNSSSGNNNFELLECKLCNHDSSNNEFTSEEFGNHFEQVHQNQYLQLQNQSRPCAVCLEVFTTNVLLGKHLYTKHKIGEFIHCEVCKKEFIVSESLKRHHLQLHKDIPIPTALELVPPILMSPRSRPRPRGDRVGVNTEEVKAGRPIKDKGPFQCPKCGKILKNKRTLKGHVPPCHGLSVHKCKECDLSFKYGKGLSLHVSKDHRGIEYLCSECGKSFASLPRLNRHITEVHRNDRSGRHKTRMSTSTVELDTNPIPEEQYYHYQ